MQDGNKWKGALAGWLKCKGHEKKCAQRKKQARLDGDPKEIAQEEAKKVQRHSFYKNTDKAKNNKARTARRAAKHHVAVHGGDLAVLTKDALQKAGLETSKLGRLEASSAETARQAAWLEALYEEVWRQREADPVRRAAFSEALTNAQKEVWRLRKADPEAFAAYSEAHIALWRERKRHAAWLEALSEVWRLRKADPDAFAAWQAAHRAGVEAFQADPVRHAAWLAALSKAHIALWRDPDWVLSRNRAYYAVRPLPEARAAGFHLLLAGWDGRTASFLLSAGIPLARQALDDSTPRALRSVAAASYGRVEVPKVKYKRATPTPGGKWTSTYHPDHGFGADAIPALVNLGVPAARLGSSSSSNNNNNDGNGSGNNGGNNNNEGAPLGSAANPIRILGETKCVKGQACRGEMAKDRQKWLAAADQEGVDRLVIFAWYMHGLVIGTVNSRAEIAEGASSLVQVHRTFAFMSEAAALTTQDWLKGYHARAMAKLDQYADREKNRAPWLELDRQDEQLSEHFHKSMRWYSHRLYERQEEAQVICLGVGDRGVVVREDQVISLSAADRDPDDATLRIVPFCLVSSQGIATPFSFPALATGTLLPALDGVRQQSFADGRQKRLRREDVQKLLAQVDAATEDDDATVLLGDSELDQLEDAMEDSFLDEIDDVAPVSCSSSSSGESSSSSPSSSGKRKRNHEQLVDLTYIKASSSSSSASSSSSFSASSSGKLKRNHEQLVDLTSSSSSASSSSSSSSSTRKRHIKSSSSPSASSKQVVDLT
jgi:hypothetical protein